MKPFADFGKELTILAIRRVASKRDVPERAPTSTITSALVGIGDVENVQATPISNAAAIRREIDFSLKRNSNNDNVRYALNRLMKEVYYKTLNFSGSLSSLSTTDSLHYFQQSVTTTHLLKNRCVVDRNQTRLAMK